MSEKLLPEKQDQSLLTLIQQVKDGTVDPKTINKELRQQLVEVFLAEGHATPSIAKILNVSDRTVSRDIKDIRDCNALSPDINLAKRFIGEMVTYARLHRAHLMRMARTQGVSVSERSQSEYYAARVWLDTITKLQTLGYLPLRPQEIIGDLFHHSNDENKEKSFAEVRDELSKVIEVAQECGTLTPELEQNVNNLNQKIEKAQIVHQVEKLSEQTIEHKEASDER